MTETFECDPTGERPDRPRLANQPEPSVAWSGGDPGCEAYTGSLAGRVIEPRNRSPCGSRRCDKSGRHHRGAEAGRALAVPPGSESGACGQGSPGNLGGLVVSTGEAARAAAVNSSPGPLARPERAGANRADGGTAKRRKTKRGGTGGEKSESADSTAEAGEPAPRGPGGGKRRIGSWTVGRTDGLATEPAAVSTQARQLAESRPKRRLAGARQRSDAMVRGAGCANRARPDLREPGEGNHPRPPGPSRCSASRRARQRATAHRAGRDSVSPGFDQPNSTDYGSVPMRVALGGRVPEGTGGQRSGWSISTVCPCWTLAMVVRRPSGQSTSRESTTVASSSPNICTVGFCDV